MEITLDQALQKGVEAHKAGKVEEADRYYTAILKANPKHPDANHNLGLLAVGIGKVEEAIPFFKAALEANSNIAQYWLSYLDALIKLDRMADAKEVFEQAKRTGAKGVKFDQLEKRVGSSTSKNSDTQEPPGDQFQSIVDLYMQGQYQEALTQASQVLKQFPNSINLYNIVGAANQGSGKLEEAIEAYKKALTVKPDYAEAYSNMGSALKDQGKLEEAIEAYKKALSIKPDYAEAYNNMGNALKDRGKLEEAIEAYNIALTIKYDYGEAYYNMGVVLQEQGELEEAIEAYKKALSIKPDYAEAYNNMGNALKDRGKLEEAIQAYNKALTIKPDYAEVNENFLALKTQLSENIFSEICEKDQLSISNSALIERPKYQIFQAIRAFLLNDQKLVRQHLNRYEGSTRSSIAKLKSKDQVFCYSYNHFLQKLIETPSASEASFDSNHTVFHLGESHCLSYGNKKIKIQDIDHTVAPRITFGGKAYHFSTDKENAFKAITKANFHSLPDCSKVFISFGEIDCRPNEGFISAASKFDRSIEIIISDTIAGYVNWFAEQNQTKNHRLFFFNVPAPVYDDKYPTEENEKVKSTITSFNNLLNKTVLKYDFNIIDVHKCTVRKDGFSNNSFHIDKRHLSSDVIPEIEKQFCSIL